VPLGAGERENEAVGEAHAVAVVLAEKDGVPVTQGEAVGLEEGAKEAEPLPVAAALAEELVLSQRVGVRDGDDEGEGV